MSQVDTVKQTIADASSYISKKLGHRKPSVAIVLGSGLGRLSQSIDNALTIPYDEIPGFPRVGVAGHAGELVAGELESKQVLLQSGRFHLYEGHEPSTVVLPIRVFSEIGLNTLIVTNAAGGINRNMKPPTLMLISDHINHMSRYPLAGPVVEPEERFPDMSQPYDLELRSIARRAAIELGIELHEGVYAGLLGPAYETPAEVRMLDTMGADAVGMSTVPEVIVARARGLRVLGFSTVTNRAAGLSPTPLSHSEVIEAGDIVADSMEKLVRKVVREIG